MIYNQLPLVTIGIPTYNRADSYLINAIHSAVNQTYSNIEIIISDNASTDNTETIVKGFCDPWIRYFKQSSNIGGPNNVDFCVEQARGDYFILLHDDDLIDSDFIETCMKAVNYDTNIGLIRTGMRRIDSQGRVVGESQNLVGGLSTADFFLGYFSGKTPMHLCSTLFNTKRLREIGGFKSKHQLFDDVLAEVIIAAKFGRADVKEIKASFRVHPAQSGRLATFNAWCEDSLLLLNTMCDLVSENKKLVKTEGWQFITKHNYRKVSNIKSPLKRFMAYFAIYKKLDHQYSPLRFFLEMYLHRMRQIKDKFMRKLRITQNAQKMI